MWFLLTMAVAWGETWSLRVPSGQGAREWGDALALVGLELAGEGSRGSAEIVFTNGQWWLQVQTGDGDWRRATIPAPSSPQARETIVRQAQNMLTDRERGVQSPWEPDLSSLIPSSRPEPPAPAPAPAPARAPEPTPRPRSPPEDVLVPRFGAAPPVLAEAPLTAEERWWQTLARSAPLPAQVLSYPQALQPPAEVTGDAVQPEIRWRVGGASSLRLGTRASASVLGEVGLPLGRHWTTWVGLGYAPPTLFTELDGNRRVQTLPVHGGLWWQPWEPPVTIGGMGGLAYLRFTQDDEDADQLVRPFAALEAAYGTRLQVFARASSEILPVLLIETDDETGVETELGRMRPVVWIGGRWELGRKN